MTLGFGADFFGPLRTRCITHLSFYISVTKIEIPASSMHFFGWEVRCFPVIAPPVSGDHSFCFLTGVGLGFRKPCFCSSLSSSGPNPARKSVKSSTFSAYLAPSAAEMYSCRSLLEGDDRSVQYPVRTEHEICKTDIT